MFMTYQPKKDKEKRTRIQKKNENRYLEETFLKEEDKKVEKD